MTLAEVQRYPSHVMDETPRWYNPSTGRMEVIPSFNFHDPLPEFRAPDLETDKIVPGGPYTGNPLEGFGPIGPYRPEIDKSEVVPLEDVFRSLFSIAGTGDVEKEDYDNLQRQYQKEYDEYMNPKGLDTFAPPIDRAGGPELFPIKKDVPGQVRGVIRGVQGLDRNDLSKPYGGIKKAALDSLYGQLFEIATGTGNPVGDSVPIAPYKTRNGIEYLPYPYGPKQAPRV